MPSVANKGVAASKRTTAKKPTAKKQVNKTTSATSPKSRQTKTITEKCPVRKEKTIKQPKQKKPQMTPFGPIGSLVDQHENPRQFVKQAVIFPNYMQKSTVEGCGYGLFAGKNYRKGQVVEENPYMIVRASDIKPGSWTQNAMDCYWFCSSYKIPLSKEFRVGKDKKRKFLTTKDASLIIMGPASFMNSFDDDRQNVDHANDADDIYEQGRCLRFVATRDIRRGEELFINYGSDWFQETSRDSCFA